jgi:hypothetical protein
VFERFIKRKKANVYLGSLAVTPRSDLKRYLDEWGIMGREDLDSSLRLTLEESFCLPLATSVETPLKTDLGLDVVVPKFQSGDAWDISLGEIGFPILWRPNIEIGARLYNLKSGKTVHTVVVLVKLRWKDYFSRIFTWRAFLRFKPMFDSSDMNLLLQRACIELLSKLRKVV